MKNEKTTSFNGISEETLAKYAKLKKSLGEMSRVLVAFSGGVDSTFLVKVAKEVLGDAVLAVIATSASYPKSETDVAVTLAEELKLRYRVIQSREMDNPDFLSNPPDRCYHCKTGLFSDLKEIAAAEGIPFVLDGSNQDDTGDYRPGLQACAELGIKSPLRDAALDKKEIRLLSKELGLPTWNKPSMACLASRFPYHTHIDETGLNRIARAEEHLRSLGFHQVRVRHHGQIARIEVDVEDVPKLTEPLFRGKIVEYMNNLGYLYVTLDLAGYRTGSMNEPLIQSDKSRR
ncbi:MAG: ATP-dependent sacrificial sulfur transferase LarE [Candidatus Aminicenantes bacterium]|nr:ATP-dependent sacrificial sulfur transferase LarE [Candidatus Aminicenantes bacterium]